MSITTHRRHVQPFALFVALGVLAPWLSGCAYQLSGMVVEGQTPDVLVVNHDDPRLDTNGLAHATIEVTLDPLRMSEKNLGQFATGDDGRFVIPVREVGAGMLEYEVEVLCRLRGYEAAVRRLPLPGKSQRLLIVMTPGRDTYQRSQDVIEDSIKAGREQGLEP